MRNNGRVPGHGSRNIVAHTRCPLVAGVLRILLHKRKGRSVLLLGPSGSGKTTLFLQLRDGDIHNGTVASMQENAGTFVMTTEKVSCQGH